MNQLSLQVPLEYGRIVLGKEVLEMRLIDADAFRAEIAEFYPHSVRTPVANVLRHTKTVDAVPVVRCYECGHSDCIETPDKRWCYIHSHYVAHEGYCDSGERKMFL